MALDRLHRSILELIAGSSRVEARRVVAGDPTTIQQQIELQLRDQEKLSALRRRPLRSVWEASPRVMHRLERSLNLSGKEYALAEARQVQLAVAETEPGWSLVTLAADVANKRNEILYSAGSAVAILAIFGAVFTASSEPGYVVLLAAGAALLAGLSAIAASIPWVRWTLNKRRARVELILESLLDQVDR
ncbi:MAG: hypothetical protein WD795_12795 [Woeseia sp.]